MATMGEVKKVNIVNLLQVDLSRHRGRRNDVRVITRFAL
jgi:hypothetical protein